METREKRTFSVTIHNDGLRSRIDCGLCANCPRDDLKGCCHYSPTFTVVDLAYFALNQRNEILEAILTLPKKQFLAFEVRADALDDGSTYGRCPFHGSRGCKLPPLDREFICRQFICSGIKLWVEPEAKKWQLFWDKLVNYDTELYVVLGEGLKAEGLTLKDNWQQSLDYLAKEFELALKAYPQELLEYPKNETFVVTREVVRGKDWRI